MRYNIIDINWSKNLKLNWIKKKKRYIKDNWECINIKILKYISTLEYRIELKQFWNEFELINTWLSYYNYKNLTQHTQYTKHK